MTIAGVAARQRPGRARDAIGVPAGGAAVEQMIDRPGTAHPTPSRRTIGRLAQVRQQSAPRRVPVDVNLREQQAQQDQRPQHDQQREAARRSRTGVVALSAGSTQIEMRGIAATGAFGSSDPDPCSDLQFLAHAGGVGELILHVLRQRLRIACRRGGHAA